MSFDFADGIKWYLVFLFSTSWHEAAHAWTASKLGDDTARRGGQVALDPSPHIKREPVGMVVVPILSFILGGWLIGWASTPYDPEWARRHPRRLAIMGLAGPAANVALIVLAVLLMRAGMEWEKFRAAASPSFMDVVVSTGSAEGMGAFAAKFISLFFSLNLLLAVFNLLPFPPLDGSNLPMLLLPSGMADGYRSLLRSPGFQWIGLFVSWKLLGSVFPSLFQAVVKLLDGILLN